MPYTVPSWASNPYDIGTNTDVSATWASGPKVLRFRGSFGPPDTSTLHCRTSVDGSAFDSTAGDYEWNHDDISGSGLTARSSTSDDAMDLALSCGSATTEGFGFDALLFTGNGNTEGAMLLFDGSGVDSGSNTNTSFGGGKVLHSDAENLGFQIGSSAGTAFVDGNFVISEYTAPTGQDTTSTGVRDFAAALDVASQASVSATWTTGNGPEVLKIIGRIRGADAENLILRVSTDGTSFAATGYDCDVRARTPGGGAQIAPTTYFPIFDDAGGAAGEVVCFEAHLFNLKGGNGNVGFTIHSIGDDSTANLDGLVGGGYYATNSEILGVQILTSAAGNMNEGFVWLYDVPVE